MFPNPANLAKGGSDIPAPSGPELGTITLEELHKYDCNNPDRRILSLFGTLFDVTSSEKSYGKSGACKFGSAVVILKSRLFVWLVIEFLFVDEHGDQFFQYSVFWFDRFDFMVVDWLVVLFSPILLLFFSLFYHVVYSKNNP